MPEIKLTDLTDGETAETKLDTKPTVDAIIKGPQVYGVWDKDEVMVVVARGDKRPDDKLGGMCNGDIIDVIDPQDKGWPEKLEISEHMAQVYELLLVPRSLKEKYKEAAEANVAAAESKDTKRKQLDISKPEFATAKTVFNTATAILPIDVKKYDEKLIVEKEVDGSKVVKDVKAIAEGTYTVGSGGAYANLYLGVADFTTQTGILTLQAISNFTDTTAPSIANNNQTFNTIIDLNGFTATAGITGNYITVAATSSGSGDTIIKNGTVKRSLTFIPTASLSLIVSSTSARTGKMIFQDLIVDSSGQIARGITTTASDSFSERHVIRCSFVNFNVGIPLAMGASAPVIAENCNFGNGSGLSGRVSNNSSASTYNSCAFFGFVATGNFTGATNSVSNNCATDKASVGAGTNNNAQVNLKASEQFYSLDPLHIHFGRPKTGSVCSNGGATPTLSSTDYYGAAWSNPAPIGIANYTAITLPLPPGLPDGTKAIPVAIAKSNVTYNGVAPYLLRLDNLTATGEAAFWTTITSHYERFGICKNDGTICKVWKDTDCFDVGNKKGSVWFSANIYNENYIWIYYSDSTNVTSTSQTFSDYSITHRWGMNEGSGTSIVDDVLATNGTISGTCSLAQVGQICRAISATNAQIQIPNQSLSPSNGDNDIKYVWVFLVSPSTVASGNRTIYNKGTIGTDSEVLARISTATFEFYLSNPAGTVYIGRSFAGMLANTWQCVVVTYSGSETAAGIKTYLNGIEQAGTALSAGSYTGCTAGDGLGSLLCEQTGENDFTGLIDETWMMADPTTLPSADAIYSLSNGMLNNLFTMPGDSYTVPASGGGGNPAGGYPWLWYRMYQRAKARRA